MAPINIAVVRRLAKRVRRTGVLTTMVATVALTAWGASARAQTIAREDLVGTWVSISQLWPPEDGKSTPRIMEDLLTFQADSTWTSRRRLDGVESSFWPPESYGPKAGRRWYLAGDTLWFANPAKLNPDERYDGSTRLVRRNGEQLTLGHVPHETLFINGPVHIGDDRCPHPFTRATSANPSPATLPPSTLNMADLVGTWVSSAIQDTLTLRSDSTLMMTGTRVKIPAKGTWALAGKLFGNDVLWLHGPSQNGGSGEWNNFYKAMPQGSQLVLHPAERWDQQCADTPDIVYQRVSP